jgi:acetylornithine/N-succinyldiaminopimelate aminotransferase
MNEQMNHAEENILHTYNRFPVMFDHGEGCYLYDTEGKKYLDFAAGIAVNSLGYHYPGYDEALKAQIDKLTHISNLYYNEPMSEAGEKLVKASGLSKAFFTNSGTEAIEGALKAARKYAYTKYGKEAQKYEIIAMNHSFHGRSMGALSVTGTEHYREPFEPLVGGVKFADFNDLDSVKAQITDKTCAIILEPLQGEGGINLATEEFMKGIRKLCDEEGILMICDEVQCGMGRTGSMFTWQSYGIRPDIMSMAKAIGNGIPVGAFAMTEEIAKYSLEPGDHGTTYGGNPLACTAVSKTIEIFEKKNLVAHVQELGAYLTEKLEELKSECDCVKAVKGKGLMQGIQVTKPLSEITKEALKEGLLIIGAGNDVIRFVPPLIIEKEHVDEMIRILKKVL